MVGIVGIFEVKGHIQGPKREKEPTAWTTKILPDSVIGFYISYNSICVFVHIYFYIYKNTRGQKCQSKLIDITTLEIVFQIRHKTSEDLWCSKDSK